MRISTFKTALRQRLILLGALFCLPFFTLAQGVYLSVHTTQVDDVVTAEFRVSNFTDILSFQFTIDWDPTEMAFQNIHSLNSALDGLNNANFGTANSNAGIIAVSWFDPLLDGSTLTYCENLFSISFQLAGSNIPPISITGNPTPIEVVDINGNVVQLLQTTECTGGGQITGNVFHDADSDCLPGAGETKLNDWKIKAEGNGYTFYGTSNTNGNYNLYAPAGQYDLSVILPGTGLWTTCQPVQTVTVIENDEVVANFAAQALLDCPQLNVDISAPFLRRCFTSNYYVNYCNEGTLPAEDAYVEITFDPYLEITGSSLPWTSVDGQTYTFDLGDVAVGECGSFTVDLEVSCDAVLGQTHCTEAHIFPDNSCIPTSPLWDGSDLEVNGNCEGDSVRFTILNRGDDMAQPVEFIVIEDDMIHLSSDPFQLNSLQMLEVAFPANGSTWRVQTEETPSNPFETLAAAAVEGCGTNGSGSFSLGFVTQFPLGDESPFIDEDCQENIGSFDPNDKTGYPKGFCAAHYTRADQDIEYLIRFQNTGTDTAFNIVIQDTLSSFFDPETVRPGAASHDVDFELLGNGVIRFSFDNIMLPDSNVNEAASHGFVKFLVSQKANNPPGTLLENQAAIYFDFNEPVFTNRYRHTVGENFMGMTTNTGDLSLSGFVNTWYDTPVEDVELMLTDVCPAYSDASGYFLFTDLDTANYTLSASRVNDKPQDGVTVLDLLKTRNYILTLQPFQTVYQQLAADLNNSNSVTTFDLVMQLKMALGIPLTGTSVPSWKFIAANTTPLSAVHQYVPLETSLDHQDFIAIKPGNVITENMVETSPLKPYFYFVPSELNGDMLTVDVRAKDFITVNGFQFGLQWDPAIMEFAGAEYAELPPLSFDWYYSPAPGKLSILTFKDLNQVITLPDDATLFTLTFKTPGGTGSTTPLTLDETNMPFQVVVDTCKLAAGSLQNAEITVQDPTSVSSLEVEGFSMKIVPNPVKTNQLIFAEITSGEARTLAFQVFDTNGVQLGSSKKEIQAGSSIVTVSQGLGKGLYLVKVMDENGKRMALKLVVF